MSSYGIILAANRRTTSIVGGQLTRVPLKIHWSFTAFIALCWRSSPLSQDKCGNAHTYAAFPTILPRNFLFSAGWVEVALIPFAPRWNRRLSQVSQCASNKRCGSSARWQTVLYHPVRAAGFRHL